MIKKKIEIIMISRNNFIIYPKNYYINEIFDNIFLHKLAKI